MFLRDMTKSQKYIHRMKKREGSDKKFIKITKERDSRVKMYMERSKENRRKLLRSLRMIHIILKEIEKNEMETEDSITRCLQSKVV